MSSSTNTKHHPIVSAPGGKPDSKLVLSYQGKRPHLVEPKNIGAFSCDADCPNCKSMGTCAYRAAVVESCKKLPEFVGRFKESKGS